ncbi:hypothetical protein ABZ671_04675 [Micromonospora sp. NPDC006766]|uniref:hypothetical protein n=1 Tax=Micromonospora sp. NPDC006766 TaxID=3154778 RepID=UPI00340FF7CD
MGESECRPKSEDKSPFGFGWDDRRPSGARLRLSRHRHQAVSDQRGDQRGFPVHLGGGDQPGWNAVAITLCTSLIHEVRPGELLYLGPPIDSGLSLVDGDLLLVAGA